MSNVVRVSAHDAEDELRSFFEWLRSDPEVRRHAVLSLEQAEVGQGEMGGALESVQLVIDTSFQVLNLGLAYVTWRSTRRRAPALTIERDGVRITLDDPDPEAVARLVRALEEEPSPSGDGTG